VVKLSMAKLYLIQRVTNELKTFIEAAGPSSILLLLSPEAVAAFGEHTLKTYCVEDLISSESLNNLGLENIKRTDKLADLIDNLVQEHVPLVKEQDLYFGTYHWYFLKTWMDVLTSRLLVLDSFASKLSVNEIVCDQHEPGQEFTSGWNIYSALVPIFCEQKGMKYSRYPFVPLKVAPEKRKRRQVLLKNLKKVSCYITGYIARSRNILNQRRLLKYKILSFNPHYDQNMLINDPQVLRSCRVWTLRNGEHKTFSSHWFQSDFTLKSDVMFDREQVDESCQQIKKVIDPLCDHFGVNWAALMDGFWYKFASRTIMEGCRFFLGIKNLLNNLCPDFVLSNFGIIDVEYGLLFKASRDCGIPYVMCQHGGGGYGITHVPSIAKHELMLVPGSHYLFWGEGVVHYFKEVADLFHVRTHAVGSSYIKKIYFDSRKKIK
jgi:hypothetical protein